MPSLSTWKSCANAAGLAASPFQTLFFFFGSMTSAGFLWSILCEIPNSFCKRHTPLSLQRGRHLPPSNSRVPKGFRLCRRERRRAPSPARELGRAPNKRTGKATSDLTPRKLLAFKLQKTKTRFPLNSSTVTCFAKPLRQSVRRENQPKANV